MDFFIFYYLFFLWARGLFDKMLLKKKEVNRMEDGITIMVSADIFYTKSDLLVVPNTRNSENISAQRIIIRICIIKNIIHIIDMIPLWIVSMSRFKNSETWKSSKSRFFLLNTRNSFLLHCLSCYLTSVIHEYILNAFFFLSHVRKCRVTCSCGRLQDWRKVSPNWEYLLPDNSGMPVKFSEETTTMNLL